MAVAAFAAFASPASATTYNVDPTADDGNVGALRHYVSQANANPGPDVINVPAGSFSLFHTGGGDDANATGDLDVTDTLTVRGAGQADTTLVGVSDRIFELRGAGTALTLSDMTMRGGSSDIGAAVYAGQGIALTIERCRFTANNVFANPTFARGVVTVTSTAPFALAVADSTFDANNVGASSNANTSGSGVLNISPPGSAGPVKAVVSRTRFTGNHVGGVIDAAAEGVIHIDALSTEPWTADFDHVDVTGNTLGGGTGRPGNGGGDAFGSASVDGTAVGRVTFTDSSFTGNTLGGGGTTNGPGGLGWGGGIEASGPHVAVARTLFANNVLGGGGTGSASSQGDGNGGGIASIQGASLDVDGSTFVDNTLHGLGLAGGVGASTGGPITITNSTFARNWAADARVGAGGGVWLAGADPAPITLRNLTFDANKAGPTSGSVESDGGAVYVKPLSGGPAAVLSHLTVTGNHTSSGGGSKSGGVTIDGSGTVANSVFSGNTHGAATSNCAGTITSGGGNIEQGASSCAPAGPASTIADPQLGPLQDNGGPVPTRLPLVGSPAVDAGVPGSCAPDDARGLARFGGLSCDSGAVESPQPGAGTGDATGVTTSAATIPGSVTTRGADTTYHVDFGPDAAHLTSTADASAGGSLAPSAVSIPLGGLSPSTTYVYELVATNAYGSARSGPRSFTTAGLPSSPGVPLAITSLSAGGKRFQQGKAITFAYGLSLGAKVKLALVQQVPGHRKNARSKCRKSLRKGKRCTIASTRGTLSQTGVAGANKLRFSGKFKRRKLPLGRYQAVLTASVAGAEPVKRTVDLTIVKAKRKKKR